MAVNRASARKQIPSARKRAVQAQSQTDGARVFERTGTVTLMAVTILAVDDSASMRQMVSFTLKHAGYTVVQATDGVEALEYARANLVSLVLTDVNMPRMDGITLVRELRQLDTYKFVPMLVLTTEAGQDKKMAGKQAGATGWLVKPFNPEKLLATIAKVL